MPRTARRRAVAPVLGGAAFVALCAVQGAAAQAPAHEPALPRLLEDVQRIEDYYRAVRGRLEGERVQPPAPQRESRSPPAPEVPAEPAASGAAIAALPAALSSPPSRREDTRNPFAATARILDALQSGAASARYGFRTLDAPVSLPRMSLKGLLHHAGGEVAALLEIERLGVFIVREGDTVGLHELDPEAVIRVREINRLNLVLEAGSLGRILIVR